MKCLQIISCLMPGGIETMVSRLLCEDSIYIAALGGDNIDTFRVWPHLKLFADKIFFLNKPAGFRYKTVNELSQLVSEHEFTAIHSHHLGPLIYSSLLHRKHPNLVHVHTEHDSWHFDDKKNRLRTRLMFWLNPSLKLVAVSHQVADDCYRYFPNTPVQVIHNGVDTQKFAPMSDKAKARKHYGLPVDKKILLAAGRLIELKGFRYLIEAMCNIPSNYHLAIAGSGPDDKVLRDLIEEFDLGDRVSLLGMVNDMPLFYNCGDLFCMTSTNEGLPFSILEAQSCNLPILCTDVGGCKEALSPEGSMLISPGSSEKIVEAILNSNTTPHCARDFIIDNFSYENTRESYFKLYS